MPHVPGRYDAGFPLDELGPRVAKSGRYLLDILKAIHNTSHIYPMWPAAKAITKNDVALYRAQQARKGYVAPGTGVPKDMILQ